MRETFKGHHPGAAPARKTVHTQADQGVVWKVRLTASQCAWLGEEWLPRRAGAKTGARRWEGGQGGSSSDQAPTAANQHCQAGPCYKRGRAGIGFQKPTDLERQGGAALRGQMRHA